MPGDHADSQRLRGVPMSRVRKKSLASTAQGSGFSSRRPSLGALMLDSVTRLSVPVKSQAGQ